MNGLPLFLITRKQQAVLGEFDGFVIAANDAKEARNIAAKKDSWKTVKRSDFFTGKHTRIFRMADTSAYDQPCVILADLREG